MKLVADFMKLPEIERLFSILETSGCKGCVRFVGGCVRNSLLGVTVKDVDLATTLLPEDVEIILNSNDIRTTAVGKAHGTIGAIVNSKLYEITTLRIDTKTDGRHAEVSFTENWVQDALRRDFTINALYADLSGNIYDPTEQGLNDISSRIVRFIGNPDARIKEDYLRILRFYRFSAYFSINIDFLSMEACGKLMTGLRTLSAERVWQELLRLLAAEDPTKVIFVMWQQGILEQILPMVAWEMANIERFNRLCKLNSDPLLRFIGLLYATLDPNRQCLSVIQAHLRLSKLQTKRVISAFTLVWDTEFKKINIDYMPLHSEMNCLKKWVYVFDNQTVRDALFLHASSADRYRALGAWLALADHPKCTFKLRGRDLIRRGLNPGPEIKNLMADIERRWVEANFDDSVIDDAVAKLPRSV